MNRVFSKISLVILTVVLVFSLLSGCVTQSKTQKEKIVIGISWMEDVGEEGPGEDLQAYIDAVNFVNAEPYLLPLFKEGNEAAAELKKVDAIILTGGEDVDPVNYGETPHEKLEWTNLERDKSDFFLLDEVIKKDLPLLATCRGMQVLNVYSGGSLYQDIPTQFKGAIPHRDKAEEEFVWHDITINPKSRLYEITGTEKLVVNSWHHQGIKELGNGLTVVATTEDGMIEGIEKDGSSFIVGVQFHPEWHIDYGDEEFAKFFERLIKEAQ